MSNKRITIFYDVVSPFSWFGFELLRRYQSVWNGVDVALQPFFLGGVMGASGNKPPATNPYKGAQMLKEIPLFGKMYDIDIGNPANFPEKSLHAMRILQALKLQGSDKLTAVSLAFWKLYWHDKKSIESKDDLQAYLAPIVGDAAATRLVQHDSQTSEVKQALADATKEAVDVHGAFGAPWFVVENGNETMTFFGSDRMEAIAFFLGEKYLGPCPPGYKRESSKL
ncbi:hypothetical protein CcCBS67573_g01167 [Chytriomyces confervae]|uniref:Glutathione S-transferase kappa n=1 Tax=Chytriomyces confervae TaxID=246404 RepID=A0A507FMM6_9FUNG|nr:Glutathione S-transferase kappa 1 [Chytriomyces hyalinus]TPX77574.1 hypothetical protein CcCBS67573_g01167 [Chytriomyces confervae]